MKPFEHSVFCQLSASAFPGLQQLKAEMLVKRDVAWSEGFQNDAVVLFLNAAEQLLQHFPGESRSPPLSGHGNPGEAIGPFTVFPVPVPAVNLLNYPEDFSRARSGFDRFSRPRRP